ncbi:MAG TPA: hypothetical protein VKM94_00950 [Blastocatellia bacterium]|nr:hypothetical protein [Blastocatellia bacterium]
MSNYPPTPPTTPMGGPTGQPPGGFPPQQQWGAPPPPPKSGALKWILIGCGSIIIIGTIVVVLGMWFVWNKAKEVGIDPDLWQRKPALAAAKLVVASNPDIEYVSIDEGRDQITVRDKKTGKLVTVNVRQAQDGKISFRGENGEEVTLEAKPNNESGGVVSVKTKEGTAQIGAGSSAQTPSWVPAYPGATVQGNFSAQNAEGTGGSFTFVTGDSPEQVSKFYDSALRQAGFKPKVNSITAAGVVSLTTVIAEEEDKRRTVSITAVPGDNNQTVVTVAYQSK